MVGAREGDRGGGGGGRDVTCLPVYGWEDVLDNCQLVHLTEYVSSHLHNFGGS